MNFTNVPLFVSALSKENLIKMMREQNTKDSTEHNYFSIQQDKQFWVAWYYDTCPDKEPINVTPKEGQKQEGEFMIDLRNSLEVMYTKDGASFTNYKYEAQDFSRDSFDVTLNVGEYIYVGFYKPINTVYVDILSPNTVEGNLVGEYFNGTSFVPLKDYLDETKNLLRSGFVSWKRNLEDETSTKVNETLKYWYRFSSDVNSTKITFNAINILFSDDQSLKTKFNKILSEEFLDGELSHNKVHAACRDEILEVLRRRGYTKYNGRVLFDPYREDPTILQITAWDLHDIFEVKEAATYLALSKIFFDFSDKPDDVWLSKSEYYRSQYKESLDVACLSLDANDNGKVEEAENKTESKMRYISR